MIAANDFVINVKLGVDGAAQREASRCLGVECVAESANALLVCGEFCNALAEGFAVPCGEEHAADTVIDELGNTADAGSDGRLVVAGTLRQHIGEGLGKGSEGVDVDGVEETLHSTADPACKAGALLNTQFFCEGFQFLFLRAVTCDDETELVRSLRGKGEATQQGGDVLHRVKAGCDTYHDAVLIHLCAETAEIVQPILGDLGHVEIETVVDGVETLGGEAAGDQQIHHSIGHAHAIVHVAQRDGVDVAVHKTAEGAPHVIQLIVAVNGGDHGDVHMRTQQRTHHVGAGTMAVDDIIAVFLDHPHELTLDLGDVVACDHRSGDAESAGIRREVALAEGDQIRMDLLIQTAEQTQQMGLGAACIAAADQMNDFH